MIKFLKRHWPLVCIGFVLIVVGLYVVQSHTNLIQSSLLNNLVSEEGLQLKNIHFTQNDSDKGMKWVLDAKEVRFSKDRRFFSFREFRLRLKPVNRPSMELKGQSGNYDKDSGEIDLRGDLQGSTDNGYKLLTEHLLYQQKDGYLKTEEPVTIIGPFFTVAGRGLYFNPEKETFRLNSDVITRLNGDSFIL
jgi:LPS export ABC transporter protein LptC